MFFFQFSKLCGNGLAFGFEGFNGLFFFEEKVVYHQLLWDKIAGPAFVHDLLLLVFNQNAVGLGLPAISGDYVTVILHYLSPVVHQVLINIIFGDEAFTGVVRQKIFGKVGYHIFGMEACFQFFQVNSALLFPFGKQRIHLFGKDFKLWVLQDRLLDLLFFHLQMGILCPCAFFKKSGFQGRVDCPVVFERLNISIRNVSLQMSFNILNILGFLTVDIAGDVQVVFVFFNVGEWDHF